MVHLFKGSILKSKFSFIFFLNQVEIKNMNSFSAMQKAIDFEIARQTELCLAGKKDEIVQETRLWDEDSQVRPSSFFSLRFSVEFSQTTIRAVRFAFFDPDNNDYAPKGGARGLQILSGARSPRGGFNNRLLGRAKSYTPRTSQ